MSTYPYPFCRANGMTRQNVPNSFVARELLRAALATGAMPAVRCRHGRRGGSDGSRVLAYLQRARPGRLTQTHVVDATRFMPTTVGR